MFPPTQAPGPSPLAMMMPQGQPNPVAVLPRSDSNGPGDLMGLPMAGGAGAPQDTNALLMAILGILQGQGGPQGGPPMGPPAGPPGADALAGVPPELLQQLLAGGGPPGGGPPPMPGR